MRVERRTLVCFLVLLVGCGAMALALASVGNRQVVSVARAAQPRTPDLIGLRRTQVLCRYRGTDVELFIDGFREDVRRRKIQKALCTGGMRIFPDPEVERQRPRAGEPLGEDQTIRLWTPCFEVHCA